MDILRNSNWLTALAALVFCASGVTVKPVDAQQLGQYGSGSAPTSFATSGLLRQHFQPGEVITYDVKVASTTSWAYPDQSPSELDESADVTVTESIESIDAKGAAVIKFKSQPVQLILNGVEQTGKGKFSALGTISETAHVNSAGTVSSSGWSEAGITDELKNVDFVDQHALLPIYLPKDPVLSPISSAGPPWTTDSDDGLKMTYSLSVGQFLSDGSDNEVQLHVAQSGTQTDQGTSQGVTYLEHAIITGGVDELFDTTSGLIRSKTSSRHRTSDAAINNPTAANASSLQIDQTWTTDAELTRVDYPN